jgi:diaminopimelate epimerase
VICAVYEMICFSNLLYLNTYDKSFIYSYVCVSVYVFLASPWSYILSIPSYGTLINLPFVKMNGLGNDFVILDRRKSEFEITSDTAKAIANRSSGIGCDQLIILENSVNADIFMRIINADGSEVSACGNATRCVGRLIMEELGSHKAYIETEASRLQASVLEARDGGSWDKVIVDMGRPLFSSKQIPLLGYAPNTNAVALDTSMLNAKLPKVFSAVNMGNPHAIFFVNDVEAHELERIGPILENHAIFPERANISLVSVKSRKHLIQRVWERGAGLTVACGTGACAAAVCAMRGGLTERFVKVTLPGGDITIEWQADGHVMMSGGVALEFEGTLNEAIFQTLERKSA